MRCRYKRNQQQQRGEIRDGKEMPGKETPVDDNVDDDVKAEADAEAVAQVEDGHVIK